MAVGRTIKPEKSRSNMELNSFGSMNCFSLVFLQFLVDCFSVLVRKVVTTTKGSFSSVDKVVLVFECGILNSNFEWTLIYNHCKVENINTS